MISSAHGGRHLRKQHSLCTICVWAKRTSVHAEEARKGLRRAPQSRGGGESRDETRRKGKTLGKWEPLPENRPQNGSRKTGHLHQCFRNCPWFPAVCAGVKVFREGRPRRQRENDPQRPTLEDPVNEDQVAMTSQIQTLDRELKLTGRDEMDGRPSDDDNKCFHADYVRHKVEEPKGGNAQ